MGLRQWGQGIGQLPKHLICTPGSHMQVKDQEPAAFHRSCRRLINREPEYKTPAWVRMTCPTQKVCGLNLGRFSHPVCIWGSWSMQRTLTARRRATERNGSLANQGVFEKQRPRQAGAPTLASQKPLWFSVSSCNVV